MSDDPNGLDVLALHDADVLVGADVMPSHIEFPGRPDPTAAFLLRCWVIPGDEFGAYLRAGQPKDAPVTELNIVIPPAAVIDIVRKLEQAALDALENPL